MFNLVSNSAASPEKRRKISVGDLSIKKLRKGGGEGKLGSAEPLCPSMQRKKRERRSVGRRGIPKEGEGEKDRVMSVLSAVARG